LCGIYSVSHTKQIIPIHETYQYIFISTPDSELDVKINCKTGKSILNQIKQKNTDKVLPNASFL
jgi:hypothetical protein